MIEAYGSADHVDAFAAAAMAEDLVALAELFTLELKDARCRRVGLAAQAVALAVGEQGQSVAARRGGSAPGASSQAASPGMT